MEHVAAFLACKVYLRSKCAIRSVTAYAVVSRTRYIIKVRVPFLHDLAETGLDLCWWIALVTSAVDQHRRILTDAFYIILCIVKEHCIVKRIRTVSRVRKPEVLPYHDTMAVASLIELHVACLTHPVSHDVEVLVGVVLCSNIIFASSVVEVALAESPVTATTDEPSAVNI